MIDLVKPVIKVLRSFALTGVAAVGDDPAVGNC
jgi:hypothetical protein